MPVRLPTRRKPLLRLLALIVPALILAACGSVPRQPAPAVPASASVSGKLPALPPAGSGRGGYYQDDGPGDAPPDNLLATPDAEPRIEPYQKATLRPYTVLGKTYTPITDERPLKQRGIGSWYGKKFHGQKTSTGELYDMYQMTAAHPTLPLPSYARVTNLKTGAQVIVRVNDRGPFRSDRIIDLSYTAALKLGYLTDGSAELEVERLLPDEIQRLAAARNTAPVAAVSPAPVTATAVVAPTVAATPLVVEAPPPVAVETLSDNRMAAAPVPATGDGYYLQLGAYAQPANAEALRARLLAEWSPTLPPPAVVEYGALFRVHSGPYASRDEAASVAQRLRQGGSQALIVQR